MKKTWIYGGLVAVWAIVFLGGPIWAGSAVEHGLDAAIKAFNENGVFRLQKASFEKGLFTSDLRLKGSLSSAALGLDGDSIPESVREVVFEGEARHGPVVVADGITLAAGVVDLHPKWTEEQQAWIDENLNGNFPASLTMKIGLSGSVDWHVDVDAVRVNEREGDKKLVFTFKPMRFVFGLSGDGNQSSVSVAMEGMEFEDSDSKGVIGPIEMHTTGTQPIEGLWLSKGKGSAAGIQVSAGGQAFAIGEMAFSSDSDISPDLKKVSAKADAQIAAVKVAGQTVAENVRYVVSVDGLDAESLARMAQSLREAYASEGGSEAVQMAMAMQLMGTLPQMVSKGMSVRIDELSGKVMGHPVKLSLSVSAKEGTDVSKGIMALATVEAAADVSLPRMLLMMAPNFDPAMVDGLIQQGFVKDEGGILTSHAEFKNMTLTVNGNTVPLPGLMPSASGQP